MERFYEVTVWNKTRWCAVKDGVYREVTEDEYKSAPASQKPGERRPLTPRERLAAVNAICGTSFGEDMEDWVLAKAGW